LADLEGRLAPACSGPRIQFFTGTRAELDALELPDTCDRCGEPLSGHPPGRPHLIYVERSDGEAGPDEDG
jgi:hypothetical protein